MKKILPILIIISLIFVVTIPMATSYAVWQQQSEASLSVDIKEAENWHLSWSGIIYVGLSVRGQSISVTNQIDQIQSFAAVAYDGIVEDIDIPNEYTVFIDGEEFTYPVTNVLNPDVNLNTLYFQNNNLFQGSTASISKSIFSNNRIIHKITLNQNMTQVEAVFQAIENLKSVEFKGNSTVDIAHYAFSGCSKLNLVDMTNGAKIRGNMSDFSNIFENCPKLNLETISFTG